jgi:hypothetical protein
MVQKEVTVNKFWAFSLLLLVALLTLSCGSGSGSGRQLQSIVISQTVNGEQIQFVATGIFSAAPFMVTPLPVFWYVGPPPAQYTLTTQPVLCNTTEAPMPQNLLTATAPADPNAASSGSMSASKMVKATAYYSCTLVQE